MVDFDSIIKTTLTTINEGFQISRKDFFSTIESINQSIKNNSTKEFIFGWNDVSEDINGSIYKVYFDSNPNNLNAPWITIDYFFIPSKGYPIEQGNYFLSKQEFVKHKEILSKKELEVYFQDMLMNPESALIQAIGFALRKTD